MGEQSMFEFDGLEAILIMGAILFLVVKTVKWARSETFPAMILILLCVVAFLLGSIEALPQFDEKMRLTGFGDGVTVNGTMLDGKGINTEVPVSIWRDPNSTPMPPKYETSKEAWDGLVATAQAEFWGE